MEVEKVTAQVVGGPEDNAGTAAKVTTDSNKTEQVQKKWTTASGKEFNTPEELHAYTSGLEEELVKKAFQQNNPPPAPAPVKIASWEEEAAETMFTDPVGTLKKVKDRMTQEIRAEDDKKSAAKAFWDKFNQDNPDLHNAQRIVNLVSKELAKDPEFGKLPAAQVSKRLADEVRMTIKDISRGGETETVVNGKAAPMLSGSNPTPKAPGSPVKPKTFIDQIKEMKAKKRKA